MIYVDHAQYERIRRKMREEADRALRYRRNWQASDEKAEWQGALIDKQEATIEQLHRTVWSLLQRLRVAHRAISQTAAMADSEKVLPELLRLDMRLWAAMLDGGDLDAILEEFRTAQKRQLQSDEDYDDEWPSPFDEDEDEDDDEDDDE